MPEKCAYIRAVGVISGDMLLGALVYVEADIHFITQQLNSLNLGEIDISSGDFPVAKLAPSIIKSSMIDYAMWSYNEEREKLTTLPVSAWFCA